jgi:hypothetical protein
MKKLFVLLLPLLSLAGCADVPAEDPNGDEEAASDSPGGPEELADDAEPAEVATASSAVTKCGTDVVETGTEQVGNITYTGYLVYYKNCSGSSLRRKVKGFPLSGKCKTIGPNERVLLKAYTVPWYIYRGVHSC